MIIRDKIATTTVLVSPGRTFDAVAGALSPPSSAPPETVFIENISLTLSNNKLVLDALLNLSSRTARLLPLSLSASGSGGE